MNLTIEIGMCPRTRQCYKTKHRHFGKESKPSIPDDSDLVPRYQLDQLLPRVIIRNVGAHG